MFNRQFFVVCPSFHGATLLGKLLNAHPAVVDLGDTYPPLNTYKQICGCGERVSQCEFWRYVQDQIGAERCTGARVGLRCTYPKIIGRPLDRLAYLFLSARVLCWLVSFRGRQVFLDDYSRFLDAIHEQQKESEIFIDGVKSISRIRALQALDKTTVAGVIHLTRNPGDFSRSWMKNSQGTVRVLCKAAAKWRLFHQLAARLERKVPYLRVGYEELCAHPDAVLERIFQFLNVEVLTVEQLQDGMHETWHFVGNNSLRYFDGRIIRKRYKLTWTESLLVRLLAGRY